MTEEQSSYLCSVLSLSLPPQMCLVLGDTLAGLGKEEKEYKDREEDDQFCIHCHGPLNIKNVTRVTKTSKRRSSINISCPRCKKVVLVQEIKDNQANDGDENIVSDCKDNRKDKVVTKVKKKKKPKEVNAGLLLPAKRVKSSSSLAVSSTKTNKLKLLMSKVENPKRGSLQDFLKQL